MIPHFLEVLVEEQSMKPVLDSLLPQIIDCPFEVRDFRGKYDLLKKLPSRLKGYASMGQFVGIVIVLDRDGDDCLDLKRTVRRHVEGAGLKLVGDGGTVVVRIAVEELEAWFLGDVAAMRVKYPRLPESLGDRAGFRDPDDVRGGTWEALERVLQDAGYFPTGLSKTALARDVAPHLSLTSNRSKSFNQLISGVRRLCGKDA